MLVEASVSRMTGVAARALLRRLLVAAMTAMTLLFSASLTPAQAPCSGDRPLLVFGSNGLQAICPDGTPSIELGVGPAAWSPDGSRIAAFGSDGLGNDLLLAGPVDQHSTQLVALDTKSSRFIWWQPAWAPDGRRIAAMVYSREGFFLAIYDAESGERDGYFPIPRPAVADYPYATAGINKLSWAPGGDKLLLSWGTVIVIDATTGAVEEINDGHAVAEWTPVGDGICYMPYPSGPGPWDLEGLFLHRLGEASPETIMDAEQLGEAGISRATWLVIAILALSPDGQKLALSAGTGSEQADAVRIYQANDRCGDFAHPLASVPTNVVAQMDWSPDAREIVIVEQAIAAAQKFEDVMKGGKPFEFAARVLDPATANRVTLKTYSFRGVEVDVLGLVRLVSWSR